MSGISREVSSSQYKRVKEVPIPEGFEGDKAYQVVLTRQWIISNYQGDGGEPLDGSIVYVIEYDGETPYVTQVDQLLNIRVTDEEGNKSVQVVEEVSQFTRGTTADGGEYRVHWIHSIKKTRRQLCRSSRPGSRIYRFGRSDRR